MYVLIKLTFAVVYSHVVNYLLTDFLWTARLPTALQGHIKTALPRAPALLHVPDIRHR